MASHPSASHSHSHSHSPSALAQPPMQHSSVALSIPPASAATASHTHATTSSSSAPPPAHIIAPPTFSASLGAFKGPDAQALAPPIWATAMPMYLTPPSSNNPISRAPSPNSRRPSSPAQPGLTPTLTSTRFTDGARGESPHGALVGSRLNWCDMICQTIAEVPDARLVLQDLFLRMCGNFPEIYQWTDGKNWRSKVKNKVKSTLSTKSHVFTKIARPASLHGRGAWWTLAPGVLAEWRTGKKATVVRALPGHPYTRSASRASGTAHAARSGYPSLRGAKSLPNIRSSSPFAPSSVPSVPKAQLSSFGLDLQTMPWQASLSIPSTKPTGAAHTSSVPFQVPVPSQNEPLSLSQSTPAAPMNNLSSSALPPLAMGGSPVPGLSPALELEPSQSAANQSPWTDCSSLLTPTMLEPDGKLAPVPPAHTSPSVWFDLLPSNMDMDMDLRQFCANALDMDLKPLAPPAQELAHGHGQGHGQGNGLAPPLGLSIKLDQEIADFLADSASVSCPTSSGHTITSQPGSHSNQGLFPNFLT